MTLLDRLRQPEYTGENRCLPCTYTNLVLTGIGTVVLAVLWLPLAVVFLPLALGSIWLRGYLVPGTPELTQRYFPDWLLARFDKLEVPVVDPDAEDIDPEAALERAGVVEPCEGVDDLCLSPEFERRWHAELDVVADEDVLTSTLAAALDTEGEVTFQEHGAAVSATVDGEPVGQWESRAALVADAAAARVLPEFVTGWDQLGAPVQGTLVRSLRVFVETCPACGGSVLPTEETVESCCRSYQVMAVSCADCGERLLEVPAQAA